MIWECFLSDKQFFFISTIIISKFEIWRIMGVWLWISTYSLKGDIVFQCCPLIDSTCSIAPPPPPLYTPLAMLTLTGMSCSVFTKGGREKERKRERNGEDYSGKENYFYMIPRWRIANQTRLQYDKKKRVGGITSEWKSSIGIEEVYKFYLSTYLSNF